MTEDQLRTAILDALTEEVARRVTEKLVSRQKYALVVCTGSTIAFPTWLVSLQQLQQDGFRFDLYLSRAAEQVLDVTTLKTAVSFEHIWTDDGAQPPEILAAPYPTIVVPAMTVNTASKIAGCIADTPASRIIFNSMMRGKNVVIAINGCCPDNAERTAKGYRMTEPLKAQLRTNLERMRDFGAALTQADTLASKTLRVIHAAPGMERKKAETAAAVWPSPAEADRCQKRILGRQDIVGMPAGSVLRIPRDCLVTQLAEDTARARQVTLLRE